MATSGNSHVLGSSIGVRIQLLLSICLRMISRLERRSEDVAQIKANTSSKQIQLSADRDFCNEAGDDNAAEDGR